MIVNENIQLIYRFRKQMLWIFIIFASINIHAQQKKIIVEGVVQDHSQLPVPYVALYIPAKSIGTTSTEEGLFYLSLDKVNLKTP